MRRTALREDIAYSERILGSLLELVCALILYYRVRCKTIDSCVTIYVVIFAVSRLYTVVKSV